MCQGIREMIEDDVKEGEMKKAKEMAFELDDMGLPAEKIAKAVKVSLETVQKWLSGSVGMAK